MAWTVSYTHQGLNVLIDSSGLIGFDLSDPESETASAVKKKEVRVLETLSFMMDEFPEIYIVHHLIEFYDPHISSQLKHIEDRKLEKLEMDIKVFVSSKYTPENFRQAGIGWLFEVSKEIRTRAHDNSKEDVNPKKVSQPRPGYIYLIKADTGHYKIGRTKNITNRMNLFEVKLPFDFELLKAIQVDNMIYFEGELHQCFAEERVNGEWFSLDEQTEKSLINLEDQSALEDFINA